MCISKALLGFEKLGWILSCKCWRSLEKFSAGKCFDEICILVSLEDGLERSGIEDRKIS